MKWNKIKEVFKERWKFYVVGYIISYFITLINNGIHDWKSLFPIKFSCFIIGIIIGTAFYHGKNQMPIFEGALRSIKYVIFMVISICIIGTIYKLLLWATGVDISFLIGF